MEENVTVYEREGQVQIQGAVGAIIYLIVGVSVATLIIIFTGALGGQTYNLVQADIGNISDATIQASVKAGIISGFKAQEQTGKFMPLIVLAVIITIIMTLILGFLAFGGMSGRGGYGGGAVL